MSNVVPENMVHGSPEKRKELVLHATQWSTADYPAVHNQTQPQKQSAVAPAVMGDEGDDDENDARSEKTKKSSKAAQNQYQLKPAMMKHLLVTFFTHWSRWTALQTGPRQHQLKQRNHNQGCHGHHHSRAMTTPAQHSGGPCFSTSQNLGSTRVLEGNAPSASEWSTALGVEFWAQHPPHTNPDPYSPFSRIADPRYLGATAMPPKRSTRQNSVANSHAEVESQGHSHAMGETHAQGGGQTHTQGGGQTHGGENPFGGGQAHDGGQVLGGEIPVGGPQQMALMFEMIKGMQQNQAELAESLRQLREANGNKEDHQNKNDNRNHEERESHNKNDTPFVTMSDVADLLRQERERPPKEPRHFVRRPPYPIELLKEPYPEKYDTPVFALFDGRKGSAMEHISKFLDSMGPFAAHGDLCLREFSKSLVDRAYTWYTVLPAGSIRTWEDMVESFCSKYFHVEEKITLVNLHSTKQQIGEDLVKYIHRFRDVSLDCHVKYQEGELVEVCIDNMLPEFRAHLENLDITRFAPLLQKARKTAISVKPQVEKSRDKKSLPQTLTVSTTTAPSGTKRKSPSDKAYEEPPPLPFTAEEMMAIFDKWVQDQVIKLPKISKQPTAEEQKNPKYCRYHRYVNHPTVDCRTLRWEVNRKIQDGTLQLSEAQQKVHQTPFPNYNKDKGKAVVSVVIHGNVSDMEAEESAAASSSLVPAAVRTLQKSPKFKSLFNQLGFGPEARNAATEALITIAAESGATCFTAEAHASRAFLETTNAITFTDEDMEVQYPDHRRPLYLSAVVKDVQVRRALVDTGSCLNLIPLSTLQAANVPQQKIQGSPMEVTGFGGMTEHTMGHVQLVLKVGPIVALTRFHVVNAETPYHVLLGRPWLHKHKCVGPDCPQQEGPTPEEGGLQPSCHLTQQTENSGKVMVDQIQSTAMNSEKVTVDHAQSTVMNHQKVAVDQIESMAINFERPAVDQIESMAVDSERPVVDQEESTAMDPGGSTVDHASSTVRNSGAEAVADQTESTTMSKEKSTTAEPNITSKEELEVINLSDDPDITKPISISKSLSAKERKCLIDLLHEYKDVFAWDYHEMPGIDPGLVAHSLNVEPGTRPVVQPMRTFHTEVEAQITQEVKKLLAAGFIKPIQHPRWLSNIVPVKKKNGQIRCCVDFRNLNKACPKDEFPLPNMDLLIDSAAGHAMFSFMDGFSGYNQIRMSTRDAEKTAFRTPIGNFYYTVMPFGLKNAGATYQRTMTAMFHDMVHKEIEDYVDDIVVKSKKREDHLRVLRKVFDRCRLYKLKMNPLKCAFGVSAGKFLGFLEIHGPGQASSSIFMPLMKKGVPFVWSTACQQAFEKIQLIMTKLPTVCAPVPGRPLRLYLASNTIKSQAIADLLAQFPGEDSSSISHEVPGEIGEALSNNAFKLDYEAAPTTPQNMKLPRSLDKASAHDWGLGNKASAGHLGRPRTLGENPSFADALATLGSQVSFEGSKVDITIDKRSMPITDLLKEKFKEQNLDAEDWRTPIRASHVTRRRKQTCQSAQRLTRRCGRPESCSKTDLCTDRLPGGVLTARCVSLQEAAEEMPGGVLARCVSLQEAAKKLSEVHERCCELRDGEQCSSCQHQHESDQVYATFVSSDWRTPFLEYLIENVLPQTSQAATRLKKLATRYFVEGGILFRKGFHGDPLRCLSLAESQIVMKEAHSGECGEHQGKKRLYQLLLTLGYYWPTMKKDTADFVKSCHTCQLQANLIHTHPTSLQNMATPWPFHTWGLDLIGPINPSSGGCIWILVATEYFTKWVEAIPLRKATGAAVAAVANTFSSIPQHIITRFGIPHKIISDNGTPFVNKNVKEVWSIIESSTADLRLITLKAMDRRRQLIACLLRILSKMVFDYGKGWNSHLADTLWAYRGSTKTATGFTPFSLVYGTDAISPTELLVPSPRILHGMDLEADADICAEARVADLEGLEEARELAQARSLRYHQKLADAYEKTLQTRIFAKGQNGAEERWITGYYKLSTADGTTLADPINGKWLKRYYS
uniref:Integrase catalytic domain-containing protein n=1 Tax=Fagus sylvatica TaxID=28930 RepID=A0A2N9FCC3_FAGSY